MASKPYFDKSKGHWYIKWKSTIGWKAARLCPHPGWTKGDDPPKRPPTDAVRLARAWEDKELACRVGLETTPPRLVPLAGFLENYLVLAAAGQTPGSMRTVRRVVREFTRWCRERKVTTLPQVTAEVCRHYLAERAKAVAHATVKTERAALSPAWSQAFQDGRVKENPWRRVPVPGKPRQEHPHFWTPEEVDRLAAACKPWLADIVIVGAYSGLRITSLLGLTWGDVDFARGVIRVRASESKSGRTYEAPMLGPARDVLERKRKSPWTPRGNPLVFPGIRAGKRMHRDLTFKRIAKAVKRAEIKDFGRYNHATRHTFATMCIHKGVPLAIVSRWLGHSSINTTQIYVHQDTRESRRWAEFFSAAPAAVVSEPTLHAPGVDR